MKIEIVIASFVIVLVPMRMTFMDDGHEIAPSTGLPWFGSALRHEHEDVQQHSHWMTSSRLDLRGVRLRMLTTMILTQRRGRRTYQTQKVPSEHARGVELLRARAPFTTTFLLPLLLLPFLLPFLLFF